MSNHNPKKENLKPFTKENAKEMGRRGGLASGITRKRNAIIKQQFNEIIALGDYIDSLTDLEYNEFIEDYTVEQKARISFYFRPTEEQKKEMIGNIKAGKY